MPRTVIGRRRKYGKRKRVAKRRTYRRRRTNPSNYAGFPKNKYQRLRFSTFKDFNMNGASAAFYNVAADFSANSIFNCEARPTPQPGDNRPIGYDQWYPFYKQYVVHKAVCTATIVPQVATISNPGVLATLRVTRDYVPDTPPLQIPLVTDVVTQGNCSYVPLSYYRTQKLKRTFKAKDFFNVKDVKDNIDDIGSDMDGDPASHANFYFQMGPVNANADEVTPMTKVQVMFTIDYYVSFHEPKPLAKSIVP